ncbi:thioredoxin-like fold domain-containing protein MRL7L, chloroplastic [Neltuma alba]|uniref:thioredoxin-like fold domain-containing protein MRL7L, chloroplastic n=1 Tax=Neltuma alba TaxID=207710 RepID=UPI0010A366A3|nr:thioredoxin-like fold domain-containing protein MRL7L, chloroplastic [Prosopis alba]
MCYTGIATQSQVVQPLVHLRTEMAVRFSVTWPPSYFISPMKQMKFNSPNSFFGAHYLPQMKQGKTREECLSLSSNLSSLSFQDALPKRIRISKRIEALKSSDASWKKKQEDFSDSDDETDAQPALEENDPYLMNLEERQEWRQKIREVISMYPNVKEEVDPVEKKEKLQKLLKDYPLVLEEDDPDWPEDADGWGFNLGQFFDKITIKNNKKVDDDNDDSDNEIVWQDDNYIRPIKDIRSAEWEETVFKDISPLVIIVHNRYKRPKENERILNEVEKAVNIIWNCRLPSPRCVAIDAVVETDLVAVLQISSFPELIFTKAGRILFREKGIRNADELSKMMAFFYYGAAKPSCLNNITDFQEDIPSLPINNPVS